MIGTEDDFNAEETAELGKLNEKRSLSRPTTPPSSNQILMC